MENDNIRQTLIEQIPGHVVRVDFPISSNWFGRGKDSLGVSELSVLFEALDVLEQKVQNDWNQELADTKLTLETIETLRADLLDATLRHLATATDLLHRLKYNQLR